MATLLRPVVWSTWQAARAYIGTGTVVIAQLGRAHLHYDAGQVGV